MKKYAGILYAALTALSAGCASTNENLLRETARAIGGNVAPEHVTVSDVRRSPTNVSWKATTPSGNYECSADDMVRRALCTRK